MEYSAESLRFLHVAYVLMALGQIAYVAFLARLWNRVKAEAAHTKSSND